MKHIVFSILLLLIGNFSIADDNNAEMLLEEAKEAYINEEYAYAAELYEEILEMGMESPFLFYNLGNAYYKTNRIGLAILNYERAAKLSPNNEKIQHNLRVANNRIVDKVEPVPVLFYKKWWNDIVNLQNMDNWAKTAIISLFLFLISAAIYLFAKTLRIKKAGFYSAIFLLFFSIFSLVCARSYYNTHLSGNQAIVMSVRTTAKSSPTATAPDVFVIHEGTKVSIINELGQWYEIRLANGNVGWIDAAAVDVI